jgi:6-phosphogluconolactonase (cycloisomerase 2 family)
MSARIVSKRFTRQMVTRRAFLSLIGSAAALPAVARAQRTPGTVVLYASVGPDLTRYDVDVAGATLTRRETVKAPAAVQYAWPHPSRRFLYLVSSDTGPGAGASGGNMHHATAWRIEPSGALTPHGDAIALPSRPIHVSCDIPGEYALVAFNSPSAVRVYRINRDVTLGREVQQPQAIDAGVFGHQILVTPDNRAAIFIARGNDAAGGRPEDPGAVKVFDYRDGRLTNEVSIAPNGGYGFGPRHLDFHPDKPWIYLSLERQNLLSLYRIEGGRVNPQAAFTKSTLSVASPTQPRQLGGAVHVHPNGRFVYVVNRADASTTIDGKEVLSGGENTLVVFRIDMATGEPVAIQHIETRGIHCRTFHIDPSGRLLVATHIRSMHVKDGATIRNVPAGMSVFRIGSDGRLEFVRKYDEDVGSNLMFWMGLVPLAV